MLSFCGFLNQGGSAIIPMHHETPHKVQFIQMFLYAGMVAEESKDKAILKKCIKRRDVNQALL